MTLVVLLGLAAIWAAVLVPPYLQQRRSTHPSSSIGDFHQQLAVLQRTGRALHHSPIREGYTPRAVQQLQAPAPRPLAMRPAGPRNEVVRRRRDVFLTLLAAAGITLFLALALGGSVWLFHLLVDAALLGYVAMLLQIQQQPARRPSNVAYLPVQYDDGYGYDHEQPVLQRTANW